MSAARQLLLGIKPDIPLRFENFIAGANAELMLRLRELTSGADSGSLYLWGPAGSGKSHLLAAAASLARDHRPVQHHAARAIEHELTWETGSLLVVDDVEHLSPDAQISVFRAFNDARILGQPLGLLLSGSQPPLRLPLREDLRTRIGQSLIYEVQPLTDEEKAAALKRHATARGMVMDEGVLGYLLRHGRRDLPSLMATLDALDHASLTFKRPPTLPLLRELMQTPAEAGLP